MLITMNVHIPLHNPRQSLRGSAFVAAARGIPLHFVVVPSAVDVCPDFGIQVDPARFPGYSPRRLVEQLTRAVGEAGGQATDLSEALRAEGASVWVGGTDIHWNAAGQRVGAARVAADLTGRADVVEALRPR